MPDADGSRPASATGQQLADVVREAGEIALRTFRQPLRQWTKAGSSPVSEADLAVDEFLRRRLGALAPGAGWLSEETEDDAARLDAASVWIVDPIDGTRAYLAGQDDWTISVALVGRGRPELAAVFAPTTQELFMAQAGRGASLNGEPIMASPGDGLAGASAMAPKRFLQRLAELNSQVVALPRIGSLALRLARVAQGRLDLCITGANSHDWDLAAADLLVHEAGGALTTLAGDPLIYNRSQPVHGILVAAGRARHAALISLVRDDQSDRS